MKLIWIATSISVKCHGWLLTKKERCGVRNGKIKLYYWTKITIAFNRNGGDNGRFFALFLPKLSICHFSLHSFSIDFKFQSCVCAHFFLLLNVLWNKTLSFFHYCLACFPFNSSVDFIFFFLIVVVVALDDDNRKKIKVARGNGWVSLGNQSRRKNWRANHSIWVFMRCSYRNPMSKQW